MLIYLYKHFSFRNIFIRWKAKQMSKRKRFSKLNLLNRFLFNEAMEDPENMKTVLDIIFGQDIPLRLAPHSEKEVRTLPDNRMKCEEVPILICKMMRHAFFWTAMVRILKWYHRNWLSYFVTWRNRQMKLPVHVQARRSSCFIRKSARSVQTKKWRRGSCERGKKEK